MPVDEKSRTIQKTRWNNLLFSVTVNFFTKIVTKISPILFFQTLYGVFYHPYSAYLIAHVSRAILPNDNVHYLPRNNFFLLKMSLSGVHSTLLINLIISQKNPLLLFEVVNLSRAAKSDNPLIIFNFHLKILFSPSFARLIAKINTFFVFVLHRKPVAKALHYSIYFSFSGNYFCEQIF